MKQKKIKYDFIDSNKFNELIIKYVKQNPVLWSSNSDDPSSKKVERNQAWKTISEKVGHGKTVLLCKKRWKTLRDRFVKDTKNSDIRWKFYKELIFLKEASRILLNLKSETIKDEIDDLNKENQSEEYEEIENDQNDDTSSNQYEGSENDEIGNEQDDDRNSNQSEENQYKIENDQSDDTSSNQSEDVEIESLNYDRNSHISKDIETDGHLEELNREDDYGMKYGEIYLLNNQFYYCCYFCDEKFVNGETFQEHCTAEHPTIIPEDKTVFVEFKPKSKPKEVLNKKSASCISNKLIKSKTKTMNTRAKKTKLEFVEENLKTTFDDFFENSIELETLKICKCNICDYQTDIKKDFKNHGDKHPGKLAYKCDLCDQELTKYRYMIEHRNIHKLKNGANCFFCEKLFVFPSKLKDHMMNEHRDANQPIPDIYMSEENDSNVDNEDLAQSIKSEKSVMKFEMIDHTEHALLPLTYLQCGLCEYNTNERQNYIDHCSINHPKESCYRCDICTKLFTQWKYLSQHRNIHSLRNGPNCKYCGKEFRMPHLLRTHEFLHKNKRKPSGKIFREMLKCGCCEYQTRLVKEYIKHCDCHVEDGKIPYMCTNCNRTFTKYRYLIYHMKLHRREFDSTCQFCGKIFYTFKGLINHEKIHKNTRPTYLCQFCNKKFHYARALEDHENIHTGNRPHKCNFCSLSFYSKGTKRIHTREKHLDDKRFSCEICGQTFITRITAAIHEASHTGKKLFVCDICGNSYTRNSALQNHLRNHADLRSFKCEICSKGFNNTNNLNSHMLIHSEEKKWACEICSRRFVSKKKMKEHSKIHFKNV